MCSGPEGRRSAACWCSVAGKGAVEIGCDMVWSDRGRKTLRLWVQDGTRVWRGRARC
jgi:hypothetical protein